MTPGSLLLGNPGQCFACGHEHGAGDRCLSFSFSPEYFEELASDVGARGAALEFRGLRVPPLRALAGLTARVCAAVMGSPNAPWDELGVELAARTVQLAGDGSSQPYSPSFRTLAQVTDAVRAIERCPDDPLTLGSLARDVGLSPYHFLRTFQRLTGVTPHQYVLRTRLRRAAVRLVTTPARVLDIALDSGFGDVSNFNHAFRAEFGVSPRTYRLREGGRTRRTPGQTVPVLAPA
jgi:AraC family transcriptional regulator